MSEKLPISDAFTNLWILCPSLETKNGGRQ